MYDNEYYGAPNDYRNYLSHHGIKGQKWGVMHGPPYPLGSHTSAMIKKGKKVAAKAKKTYDKKIKPKVNDLAKKGSDFYEKNMPEKGKQAINKAAKKTKEVYEVNKEMVKKGISNYKSNYDSTKNDLKAKSVLSGTDSSKEDRSVIEKDLNKNGFEIDKEYSYPSWNTNHLVARKEYSDIVEASIHANIDTPNLDNVAKNLNKINSDIARLRKEFAEINYKHDKNEGVPEGYPSNYAELNKKAFSKANIDLQYNDTRKYASEYRKNQPDDLYEMSMFSDVDDLEYVLRISQDENGRFYIDPRIDPEYR